MSTVPLPDRPNLDQLRRQAKELRDAASAGDRGALERMRLHPGFQPELPVKLSAAQSVVAREHGFASWPRLKAWTETAATDLAERVDAFLQASVIGRFGDQTTERRGRRARQLLTEDPRIATYGFHTAVVLGEATHVRAQLAVDPALAVRPDARYGWPPLLAVCRSHWHHIDPDRAEGMLEVARLLLDAGADPNTRIGSPGQRGYCSALYGAAGLADHPALARLLLERGADPDSPSALYHTAFQDDRACLQLLLEHGATVEGPDTLGAAISVHNLGAVRVLLDAGVDAARPLPPEALGESYAAEPPVDPVFAAISSDCGLGLVALLLERGATPDATGQGPWSAIRLATRRGRPDLADLLRQYGARDDITAVDRFLAACVRADHAEVSRMLDRHPGVLDQLTDEDRGAIVRAAEHADAAAVRLMLEAGFPLEARGHDGATPLHAAASAGSADLVRLLIERGADLEARDTTWNDTPLAWATVGSGLRLGRDPAPDWVAVVRTLLDAGADPQHAWVLTKPPSEEVASLLRAYEITEPRSADG